jgi:hypothetical protein
MKGVGTAAPVIDHETDVERHWLLGLLPRFTEKARLIRN